MPSEPELPDNPIGIARQSNWGQNQLAKVLSLTRNENSPNNETGRPALYDTPPQTRILTLNPVSTTTRNRRPPRKLNSPRLPQHSGAETCYG